MDRIVARHSKSSKHIFISVAAAITGLAVLIAGVYFGDKMMSGFVLEIICALCSILIWVYAVDNLCKIYNIVIIEDDYVRLVRSPFVYIFGGDITLRRNKNRRIEIEDKLYITHSFGLKEAAIGDTYLILSNGPIEETYTIHDDENAIVILCSEEILSALKDKFCFVEVNNLRKVVEEKGLYRIVTAPQGERYKNNKKILRSDLSLALGVWMLIMAVICMFIGPDDSSDFYEKLMHYGIMAMMLIFFLYGSGYYKVTKERITEYIIPFVPIRNIVFSDFAEIGLFTVKTRELGEDRYSDYLYFSARIFSDEERENIARIPKTDYKKIIYNEILHKYLRDSLGIELKGKLMERNK